MPTKLTLGEILTCLKKAKELHCQIHYDGHAFNGEATVMAHVEQCTLDNTIIKGWSDEIDIEAYVSRDLTIYKFFTCKNFGSSNGIVIDCWEDEGDVPDGLYITREIPIHELLPEL